MTASAKPLLENILDSADEVIKSGNNTATLRFGHDGNIISLVALLQLGVCGKTETTQTSFTKHGVTSRLPQWLQTFKWFSLEKKLLKI